MISRNAGNTLDTDVEGNFEDSERVEKYQERRKDL
jgi:hypothetical protein